ncbi:MAG: D-alanyl-D-alanine carboxypeptidase, partial [Pseudomonadota bacterium]
MSLSRRALMSGLLATVPAAAGAANLRPRLRPSDLALGPAPPSAASVLGESGLSSVTSFSLRDLSSGRVLEEHQPQLALPPASATKAVTTLYALEALGMDYQYSTVVAATGPVRDGRVQGDLYLIGGGDPHLDTDGLADLAKQVAAAGIFGVTGGAFVLGTSLPFHRNID